MKKISLLLTLVICLFCGCNMQEPPDPDKYSEYKCYDYHLACLDAYEQKAGTLIEEEGGPWFRIWFRKPVGVSDDQFVCTSLSMRHPLASPHLYIMQPSENHIDVFKDWTVKKIEIYYQDINKSKKLFQEDEPARTPTKVIDTSFDSVVFKEFVDFVTIDTDDSEKFDPQENIFREKYNENTTYKLYIRVHFNESENIVWDSDIQSYIPSQSGQRYIKIDKGRSVIGLTSENAHRVSIDDFPNLSSWISKVIDELIAQ